MPRGIKKEEMYVREERMDNMVIESNHREEVKKLEDFYVNGKIDDLMGEIDKRKKKLIKEMQKYKESGKGKSYNREGQLMVNPTIINSYFFKSINPFGVRTPMYNAEKLWVVYEYYMELIAKVNEIIGNFPPSISHFCKFCGITTSILKSYKRSQDMDMINVVERIYDEIGDNNLTMSQVGMTKERSTLFKLKSQNEMTETHAPNVNINYKQVIDTNEMTKNIQKYREMLKIGDGRNE